MSWQLAYMYLTSTLQCWKRYLESLQFVLILSKQHADIGEGGGSTPLASQGDCNGFCLQLLISFFITWMAGFCCRRPCISPS